MSWGALPFWVYMVDYEIHEAVMLGGFVEEVRAGFVRSLPDHVVQLDVNRRDDPGYADTKRYEPLRGPVRSSQ